MVNIDKSGKNESRIVPPGISILSDAASCCLLSNSDITPHYSGPIFKVERTYQSARTSLVDLVKPEDRFAYTYEVVQALKEVGAFFKNSKDNRPPNFLISNNYGLTTMALIKKHVVQNDATHFTDNVARFAHAYSSDCLINLTSALEVEQINPGDKIAMLSSGPVTWDACELTFKGSNCNG